MISYFLLKFGWVLKAILPIGVKIKSGIDTTKSVIFPALLIASIGLGSFAIYRTLSQGKTRSVNIYQVEADRLKGEVTSLKEANEKLRRAAAELARQEQIDSSGEQDIATDQSDSYDPDDGSAPVLSLYSKWMQRRVKRYQDKQ